jgi:site-specific DNA-methyltransferase (adenine-specific)
MKPYYEDSYVQIYLGDCREILPSLPKVDLVLTDPPYGINVVGGSKPFGHVGGSKPFGHVGGSNIVSVNSYVPVYGDNEPFNPAELLKIGENQIIFGANYFCDKLPPSKGWIVWDKKVKNNWNDNFSDVELAWSSFDRPTKCYRLLYMGLIQEHNREVRCHPTQKPLELIKWIVENYSMPEQIILDPYLGSGTVAVASKGLGRKCIGIEIEEKYCEISARRCQQSVMQLEIPKEKIEQKELL